jgi:hypothetical protein
MSSNLFDSNGHLKEFVYFPSAWSNGGVEEYWLDGWDGNDKQAILSHLRDCCECREKEINAMLKYASNPFRTLHREIIYLNPDKQHGENFLQILAYYQGFPKFIERAVALIPIGELANCLKEALPPFIHQKMQKRFEDERNVDENQK